MKRYETADVLRRCGDYEPVDLPMRSKPIELVDIKYRTYVFTIEIDSVDLMHWLHKTRKSMPPY
jgi:hypothetical protein